MKKLLAILLSSAMIFALLPTAVFAETEGDYEYAVNAESESVTITKYIGAGGAVEIPNTLGGKPVTSIGNDAFAYCKSLTSVTIPKSVTIIDNQAFMECSSLTSVSFAENSRLKTIGGAVFAFCTGLKSLTIPNGATKNPPTGDSWFAELFF